MSDLDFWEEENDLLRQGIENLFMMKLIAWILKVGWGWGLVFEAD